MSISEEMTVETAVEVLRQDYARHLTRQKMLSGSEPLQGKPKWQGVPKQGMKASEFLNLHYADEIAMGLRAGDLRGYDERLYHSLVYETHSDGIDLSSLLDQTHKVLDHRRELLATILDQSTSDPAFGDFFASLHNLKKTPAPTR